MTTVRESGREDLLPGALERCAHHLGVHQGVRAPVHEGRLALRVGAHVRVPGLLRRERTEERGDEHRGVARRLLVGEGQHDDLVGVGGVDADHHPGGLRAAGAAREGAHLADGDGLGGDHAVLAHDAAHRDLEREELARDLDLADGLLEEVGDLRVRGEVLLGLGGDDDLAVAGREGLGNGTLRHGGTPSVC